MKKTLNYQPSADARFNDIHFQGIARAILGVLVFLTILPISALAQNHQVRAQPTRLTVQSGDTGTITTTVYVITTNTTVPVNLAVGTLPAGVTSATLDKTSFVSPDGSASSDSATLTVQYNGSVPQSGTNDIPIIASGNYTYTLPVPIHSAVIWAGNTNNNSWADSENWTGGYLPSTNDTVVFPSLGARDQGTNSFRIFTNVIVSASLEVAGMRFSHGDSTNDQTYSFEIKSNATISVTGANGFSFLQDTIDNPGDMEADFYGGGSLVVSNANAHVALLKGFLQDSTLNLEGLSRFVADVNRIGLGDYSLYPYYTTNGYSVHGGTDTNSMPNRFVPQVTLAQTNFLRATYVDPENYNNPTNRNYSFTLSKTERQATGSGIKCSFVFGRTNVFLMDGIVFGAAGAKAEETADDSFIRFNTNTTVIPTNVMPVAYFRNADGTSRMSVFTVADATGPGGSGSGTKVDVNLTRGYVDALVDRLYLGRDRQECQDVDSAQASLSIAHGIFNVNTAYVSSQELGNNTIPVDQEGNDPSGYVRGTLNVSTSAVVVVNGTLYLGYTTADPNDKRKAEDGYGHLNISDGGKVMANTIQVGGVTKVSVDNNISITGGGTLVVTNEIGETNKSLNTLTMDDSTLTLFVDGNKTTPYVYANSVVNGGSSNVIKLASIVNVSSFPAQLPLIAYQSASPNYSVETPLGFYGYIVNNTVNKTIDVVLLNTAPAQLVWYGSPGTEWNTSSANWQGSLTFADGDMARFDDSASNPNVNVPGTIYVGGGGVLITNTALAYTFAGTGMIGGTAPMDKWGTNTLTMNANSQLPLNIHEGAVNGAGSLGPTTVGSDAVLTFSGNINRVTSSGTTVISPGATVANTVTVKANTLTNMGTINNNIVVNSNASMTITAGGKVTTSEPNNSQIDQGGQLQLDGTWQSGILNGPAGDYRIDVFGTLTGTGQILAGSRDISQTEPAERSRLNIGSGGVLSPGDEPGDIVTFTNQGRFDFVAGSKIIMDVDTDHADNPFGSALNFSANALRSDVLFVDRWSTMLGTLEITNVGSQPFTNGMVLKLFSRPYDQYGYLNVPLNDGQEPVMEPPSPGLGLVWDLSLFRSNGVVRINGTATNSIPLDFTTFGGSGTNATFSWPTNHIGWQLQTQANPLDVGLSTNWTVVPGSTLTNVVTITNWLDIGSDGKMKIQAKFYRLAHPRYQLQP